MKGYPKWFSAFFVSLVITAVFCTGVFLIPTTLELRFEWQIPWRLSGSNRIIVAALHALIGFIVFSLLVALWSIHMRHEWRLKKNRLSGILLLISLIFLMFSGVGIYYLGSEELMLFASGSHSVTGIILMLVYVWHSVLYKQLNRS